MCRNVEKDGLMLK